MLIDTIKARLKQAMLSKNETEKNILRVVLGEAQQKNLSKDEDVQRVARKVMESNAEVLAVLNPQDNRFISLTEENLILTELLPRVMDATEIEAFLLNSDGPEFERIQDAKSDGQATGIAMKALKALEGVAVDGNVVKSVVAKIRKTD